MMRPPSLLRLRIRNGKRRFGLLLPLFVVWPPLVIIALALLPLVLALSALLWPTGLGKPLLLAGPRFFGILCSLRGLIIDVQSASDHVYIALK